MTDFPNGSTELDLPGGSQGAGRGKRGSRHWGPPRKPPAIRELINARDFAARAFDAQPSPRARQAAMDASEALAEARQAAAKAFGAPRGWTLARSSFSIGDLVGRRGRVPSAPYPLLDHPTCYRWSGSSRPAAVVAQPYIPAFRIDEARAFASSYGLCVEIVDHESWYSPGACLVVTWAKA